MLHWHKCSFCGDINIYLDSNLFVNKKIEENAVNEFSKIYKIINPNPDENIA